MKGSAPETTSQLLLPYLALTPTWTFFILDLKVYQPNTFTYVSFRFFHRFTSGHAFPALLIQLIYFFIFHTVHVAVNS